MLEPVTLGPFLAGRWLSLDSMRAREAAVEAGRRACAAEQLQLLDWTVVLRQIRLGRDADGRLRFRRTYGFEFADTGDNRTQGSLTLLGDQLIAVGLPPRPAFASEPPRWH